ncbi:MAG: TatD family hydrolase [Catonella sp.]|uniref:TatD family hydrolase n=1 Tax=Catonella sp. TaxID=2382125 RepID=UPI003FA11E1F
MKHKIFETHAHYDDEWYNEDRSELISRLLNTDISFITNIGADIETSKNSVRLAEEFDRVLAVVGVHPDVISCLEEFPEGKGIEIIRDLALNPKVVAIGEIGLDYFEREAGDKNDVVKQRQKYWFLEQLGLAKELNKPFVIHSRDAAEDTYNLLREFGYNKGVIHCYSYSPEMAERFVKLGFYIGIGGVVTFKNAKKTKETVKRLGLKHIVLETDSPYLAPVPHRGSRNDSGNINYVVEEIAGLLDVSKEEVIETTFNNAVKLYELEENAYVKLC